MTLEVFQDTLKVDPCPLCRQQILTGQLVQTGRILRLDHLDPTIRYRTYDSHNRMVTCLDAPHLMNHYRRCREKGAARRHPDAY